MKYKILVTGAGSGGAENLINSLRKSSLDLIIYGSNMDEYLLAKSSADKIVWLPSAKEERYIEYLKKLIVKEGIHLVIPNNDTEVARISKDREKLPCKVFLPDKKTIEICQGKFKMYEILNKAGVPLAKSKLLKTLEDIDEFMKEFPAEKYWIRPKRGSGSMGATWVKNASQAKAWIKLWVELRGFRIEDFIISEFLPGRDYAFQSVWKDGKLIVAKMVERLAYIMSRNRLSNMSSSPSLAKTIRDDAALETIFKAIYAVSDRPHGNFCLDLKGNSEGKMCVTEFNIGRFCMITPIFDNTGKYNTAEVYVRCALDLPLDIEDPIDIEEDVFLIRELDTLPTIIRKKDLDQILQKAKQYFQ